MNMRFFLSLILLVIFSSCCDTHVEVTYEYEDVVIKRVDECGISTFYFGEISDSSPRVWTTYSGINDGFSGYLVFEKGRVEILSGDGYFESSNNNEKQIDFRYIDISERPMLTKGVYYIMLATNVEKERNVNTVSGVKVDYMD
jgi:hypothetical protein